MTGTGVQPLSLAASKRPWPATICLFLSIRIGALKPNASMLRAIALICSRPCLRGLDGSGLSSMIGRRANRPNCDGAARLNENFSFTPDFNLEFAISDIDRAFCDAACEAVICCLKVFRKTSSIRNGAKLAAFPAYLGVRKHLGLTLAFREVAADFLAHLCHVRLFGLFEMTPPTVERL